MRPRIRFIFLVVHGQSPAFPLMGVSLGVLDTGLDNLVGFGVVVIFFRRLGVGRGWVRLCGRLRDMIIGRVGDAGGGRCRL